MNDSDLKVLESTVKKASLDGMKQTLLSMGFDIENPIEMQKDFAHLREARQAREQVTRIVKRTVIGVSISGLITIVIIGIKHAVQIKVS
jgi:hypothetical protein